MPFYLRIESIPCFNSSDVVGGFNVGITTSLYYFWKLGLTEYLFFLFPFLQHYFIDDHTFFVTLYHNKSYWRFITTTTLNELYENTNVLQKFINNYESIIPLRKNASIDGIESLTELDSFYIFTKYSHELSLTIHTKLHHVCKVMYPKTETNICTIKKFKFPKMLVDTFDLSNLHLTDIYD